MNNREGKVAISGYFDKEKRKQLAILAVQEEKSQQDLIGEALDLLFASRHSASR